MKKVLSFVFGLIVYFPISYLTRLVLDRFSDIDNEWIIWLITIPVAIILVALVSLCSWIIKKRRKAAKAKERNQTAQQ